MADKFKFGISREDREKEKAERLRQLEHEVQERNMEKTSKLQQLNRKKKTNTIIVVSTFILLSLALLTFGTYNTFFKQPLTKEEVVQVAKEQSPTLFNTTGVEGFIYNNINDVFKSKIKLDDTLEYYEIDLSTVRVVKIETLTKTLADVEFLVDIETKKKDTTEKDKEGKNVVVPGKIEVDTWRFRALMAIVEDNYVFASDVTYRLEQENMQKEAVIISETLSFENIELEEPTKIAAAKTSVDGILKLLYEGNDVSERFLIQRTADVTDTYLGITFFELHQGQNQLGYNCICQYSIQSKEGITYSTTTYMRLIYDGAWKIEKMY